MILKFSNMKSKIFANKKILFLRNIYNNFFRIRGKNNRIIKERCFSKAKVFIIGNNNKVIFNPGAFIANIPIYIYGDNNIIEFGKDVMIKNRHFYSDILCQGNNIKILIGDGTTIQSAHINAQEDNSMIEIGQHCMLSEDIIIRTSDSHPIYDMNIGQRINPARSVFIGDHVWIAARVCILKGCKIGNNSIIGVGSIVTREIPSNVIAVGNPAKVVKMNVNWNSKMSTK